MQKTWLFLLPIVLTLGKIQPGEAAVIVIGGGATLTDRQPIQAVVIDSNGNRYNQTVYYNPAIGGVDIDTAGFGSNASVYFPAYGTRYICYNGFWVDEAGYYVDGGQRFYVNHPYWGDHWAGYWGHYGGWHDGWHGSWHNGWHSGWHGHEGFHGGHGGGHHR
jgi:hypothetical protein